MAPTPALAASGSCVASSCGAWKTWMRLISGDAVADWDLQTRMQSVHGKAQRLQGSAAFDTLSVRSKFSPEFETHYDTPKVRGEK